MLCRETPEGIGQVRRVRGRIRQGQQNPRPGRVRDRVAEPGQHRGMREGFHNQNTD